MPRNASGVMSLSGTFAVANNVPSSATINGYIDDITGEITNSLDRDGKATMRAHLKMGGYKLTGLGDGTAATDSAALQQVQSGKVAWADGGGTADAITASYSPAVTALVDGMRLRVRATAANATTTPTFTPNSGTITARTIKKLNNQALAVGDIAGDEHDLDLTYVATGTYWNLSNPAKAASVAGAVTATSLAASQDVVFSGFITPAQITGDQTDYAPTGHATVRTLRLSSDAYRTINSLAGGVDGREVILENVGSSTIALLEDNGSTGTAAMRFKTSAGFGTEIFAGCSALLRYDGTASRWYVITPAVASAGPTTMESAASTSSFVSPGNQHRHPGHPKFWGKVTVSAGTPTLQVSYNITSITDAATGRLTVTIATDMSGAQYCITGLAERDSTGVGNTDRRVVAVRNGTQAAGAFDLDCMDVSSGSLSDPAAWHFAGLGDQ